MVRHSIDDPDYWQERAQEALALAEQMRDPVAKQAMLKIADSYEYLAKRAAKLAKPDGA
jgi:hypothetical protein